MRTSRKCWPIMAGVLCPTQSLTSLPERFSSPAIAKALNTFSRVVVCINLLRKAGMVRTKAIVDLDGLFRIATVRQSAHSIRPMMLTGNS